MTFYFLTITFIVSVKMLPFYVFKLQITNYKFIDKLKFRIFKSTKSVLIGVSQKVLHS